MATLHDAATTLLHSSLQRDVALEPLPFISCRRGSHVASFTAKDISAQPASQVSPWPPGVKPPAIMESAWFGAALAKSATDAYMELEKAQQLLGSATNSAQSVRDGKNAHKAAVTVGRALRLLEPISDLSHNEELEAFGPDYHPSEIEVQSYRGPNGEPKGQVDHDVQPSSATPLLPAALLASWVVPRPCSGHAKPSSTPKVVRQFSMVAATAAASQGLKTSVVAEMALQRTHCRSLRPRRWSSAAAIALAVGCALVRGPHLSWVSSQWRSSRSPSNSHRAQNRHTPCQATTGDVAIVDNPAAVDASFEQKKEALRQCLAREYTSFFRPFEQSFYTDGVVFQDPLTRLEGKERYKMNVEMLSGESLIGNVLFTDGFITLHGIEDDPDNEFRLLTRWTLGFKFKLLPWRPEALFSGVSEYTIDADAKVVSQRDYWDTINLGSGGQYAPEQGLDGLADLVAQLLLPKADVKPTSWQLLRRTYDYEAYRSNGKIFAVLPKASSGDARSIATALRRHGLTPGDAVQDSGYTGIEVLSPNPWESSSA